MPFAVERMLLTNVFCHREMAKDVQMMLCMVLVFSKHILISSLILQGFFVPSTRRRVFGWLLRK